MKELITYLSENLKDEEFASVNDLVEPISQLIYDYTNITPQIFENYDYLEVFVDDMKIIIPYGKIIIPIDDDITVEQVN